MTKKDDKTEPLGEMEGHPEDIGHSSTVELHRGSFVGEIPSRHRAYMEIISLGDQNKVIELAEKDMHVGRSPKCEIQLEVDNVSRRHVRIAFRNEEYHIEDLGNAGFFVQITIVLDLIHNQLEDLSVGERGGSNVFGLVCFRFRYFVTHFTFLPVCSWALLYQTPWPESRASWWACR